MGTLTPIVRESTQRPTSAQIRVGLRKLAKIIAVHGDRFVPLFEWLEQELEAELRREQTLNRILDLARTV